MILDLLTPESQENAYVWAAVMLAHAAIAGVTYLDGPMGAQWVNPGDTVHWSTAANRIRGDFAGQWAYRIGQERGWWDATAPN